MNAQDRIDIDVFKVVNRAIAHSDDLEVMAEHIAQLLVGMLGIKGATLFGLNPQTQELEVLASFGLSIAYMNKGPILFYKSIRGELKTDPVIVRDVNQSDRLQYPEQAKEEGIAAIISIPILFSEKGIGALRLYHSETWDISEKDIDSLEVLAENIGFAMMYTRMLQALKVVKSTVNEIHDIWFTKA